MGERSKWLAFNDVYPVLGGAVVVLLLCWVASSPTLGAAFTLLAVTAVITGFLALVWRLRYALLPAAPRHRGRWGPQGQGRPLSPVEEAQPAEIRQVLEGEYSSP